MGALNQLPRLVQKEDEDVIKRMCTLLKHPDAKVRSVVPHALLKVGARGNACALESVGIYLAHPASGVKEAAVQTMECIAQNSHDLHAISITTRYLSHPQGGTRVAALHLLSQFSATCIDVKAVIEKLQDPEEKVRSAAVDCVARLTSTDDPEAIAYVNRHLENSYGGVRRSAIQALVRLSRKGNAHTIQILSGCLRDAEPDVNCAAIEA